MKKCYLVFSDVWDYRRFLPSMLNDYSISSCWCLCVSHTHTNVSVAWSFESPVRRVWKPGPNPSTLLEPKLSQHWNSDAI